MPPFPLTSVLATLLLKDIFPSLPVPPTSVLVALLLKVVLPALVASALVLTLFVLPRKSWVSSLGAALALAAGLAASIHYHDAVPWFSKTFGWQCLFVATSGALLADLLGRVPGVPVAIAWRLRAAGAGAAMGLLVPATLWTETWWLPLVFLAVILADGAVLELAAEKAPGAALPGGLALVFFGAATVIIHAHSALLTDVAFVAASSLAGIAVVAWWSQANASTAMSGVAVLLPGLLLAGHWETFSEVPWVSFALVALAPLALTPTLMPPLSWLRGWSLRGVQVGLLLLPVIVAVALAMRAESVEFDVAPEEEVETPGDPP